MKNYLIRRVAGISGILVGLYMLSQLNSKLGIIPISIGIGMLLWRYK